MKKILIAIALMFAATAVNAQMKEDFTEFRLGDYVFSSGMVYASLQKCGGGCLECTTSGIKETGRLVIFIEDHKMDIERKYGVTITSVRMGPYSDRVRINVYDTPTYNKYIKQKKDKEEMEKMDVETRLNALNDIL